MLAFFRRQNGRAFFPPLPIAALLPRSWRWADSKESQLGCYGVDWMILLRNKTGLDGFPKFGGEPAQTLLLGIFRRTLNISVT